MDRQIVYYYQRGIASYLIAKKFGVSNTYVRKLLKKSGVPIRGHDTTNKISAEKRTEAENKAITQAATQANRGSTHSLRHRSKLALARQINPTIDPTYEKPLIDLCRKMRIEVVPQKAFNKYNVDLYLVKENVVIEIFGGGFHNKKEAVDMFNNKLKYLSRQNITVVIVWADKLTFSPKDVLTACLKAKGVIIINGDGKPSRRGVHDLRF